MRRIAILVFVAVAAVGAPAPGAAAAGDLRLTPVGEPRFPDRSFVLSLPSGHSVGPESVSVTENGGPVSAPSVSPASAAGRGFGVVLVIDASRSMAGEPIENAMAAARAFAMRRGKSQPLGVVTFNSETATLLPLTTDPADIEDALATAPPLRRETRVYDGVDTAVALLEAIGATTGSVVVLSDGSDTGSRVGLEAAAARARRAGVRVFTVGLQSSAFEPQPLRQLAASARGRYSEASGGTQLAGVYEQLGAELAREHLIQYRSLAETDRKVRVRVEIAGVGVATATYHSPEVATAAAPPYERNDFWTSPVALILVSLTCGALVALALIASTSRPGRRRLRERMAQFVSAPVPADEQGQERRSALRAHARGAIDAALERMRWWPQFKEDLDVGGVKPDALTCAVATVLATILVAFLFYAASGSVLLVVPAVVGVPLGVRAVARQRAEAQRRLFGDQLADNLQVIASAQRAGHSFNGALAVSIDQAPEPTKVEFERALADERLGLPIEDALGVVAGRMKSRDLEQVILVAKLQRETGGNTAEVLDRVADTVRERGELRRLISSLTVQGRMSRWIVTALPLILLLLVSVINPEYMDPLFNTTPGRIALGIAAVLLMVGSLAIKRIVSIKV